MYQRITGDIIKHRGRFNHGLPDFQDWCLEYILGSFANSLWISVAPLLHRQFWCNGSLRKRIVPEFLSDILDLVHPPFNIMYIVFVFAFFFYLISVRHAHGPVPETKGKFCLHQYYDRKGQTWFVFFHDKSFIHKRTVAVCFDTTIKKFFFSLSLKRLHKLYWTTPVNMSIG